ncbi:MAG: PTS transporter subunit EIIC [Olsenella sp.]|nr:PTS transporter subunit EIIC [Olsenella sp.]
MGKDYGRMASEVLSAVGGRENVRASMACMTRLRITVADPEKVDVERVKAIEGVLGFVGEGDRCEVVFGPGTVNKVLDEFAILSGVKAGDAQEADVMAAAARGKTEQKSRYDRPVQRFLKRIANVFVPLLPGIIAAGLINGVCNVVNVTTGNALEASWWYQCIRTMGWALFLYLPLLVGMNASREFGGSAVLGAMAGALSISNAAMPLLAKDPSTGEAIVRLPLALPVPTFAEGGIQIVASSAYNPAAGGLLGALICGIFFALLERRLHKVMPSVLDTFLTPLATVVLGSIAAVLVLQPIGAYLTQGTFFVLQFFYDTLGVLGSYLLSATFLPLVSVGMHQALTPIHAMLNDPSGPTRGVNYLLPVLMMAGGGQVGAGAALYVRTRNERLRTYLRESIPVAVLGVGEPLMYAVTLPLGRPFACACLGAGFGGALAGVFHLGAVSQGVSGLFGLLVVVPGTQLLYVASMLVACAAGFVITYLFGVDEGRIADVFGE